ncbi:CopG family transcriptional regulator [Paraeggerthella hongkongensis]|uniref:CopG family transcriptional regulator n=1 Tax=Paraeggerthella hongkongensis TaxID=230658 RepID=A0A3N0BE11_9ACTN|nr:CopG family transcriptional regulator [Paraeggerthella hongkongensis]RNL46021.1 CopG family transcriptional regulator [Paraeggerthella hongkongensis]
MSYVHTFSCRLSDDDRRRLAEQAGRLELKSSEYLRYLIRIPLADKDSASSARCVVIDADAMVAMARELTKWGYHYNQAVHSMNTISLFIKRGRLEADYFSRTIGEINESLREVESGRLELASRLAEMERSVLVGDE